MKNKILSNLQPFFSGLTFRSNATKLLSLVIISSVCIFIGCQKEVAILDPSVSEKGKDVQVKNPITAEMAQKWFESSFGKSKTITPQATSSAANSVADSTDGLYMFNQTYQITPLWSMSEISTYLQTNPILIVPVRPILFLDNNKFGYSLVFFRDSLQNINSRLQVFRYFGSTSNATPSVQNFKGIFFQLDLNGYVHRLYAIENGQYKKQIFLPTNGSAGRGGTIVATPRDECPDPSSCPTWRGGSSWLAYIFDGLGDFFKDLFDTIFGSNGGSTGGAGGFGGGFGGLGFGSNGWNNPNDVGIGGGNGGGGGFTSINYEIDNTLFDVAGKTSRMNYYQNIYMLQMGFSDTEFEDLYFNKKLFTVVERFLNANGYSSNAVQIIKNALQTYTIEQLTELLGPKLTYGSGILDGYLNANTCTDSYLFVRVGDGFTTGCKGMSHAYLKNLKWYEYCIPELCIQVRGKDIFGQPLDAAKAAELTAYAVDNARLEMFKDLNNVITTSTEARARFKTYIEEELVKLTDNKGSCSISYGRCSGNIPAEYYYLKSPIFTLGQCVHPRGCN